MTSRGGGSGSRSPTQARPRLAWRRRQGRGGARAGAEAPVQESRRAGRGSARDRRASRRVEAGTNYRADAGHGGGYPQRHGRGDRLAPAHHPGRSDGPAPQGLCHRERQERQSRDGVADQTRTLLVREWEGTLQRVVVLESGFAWNGVTYESLSKVARAITGTNWNGPRFFGLRDRARAS